MNGSPLDLMIKEVQNIDSTLYKECDILIIKKIKDQIISSSNWVTFQRKILTKQGDKTEKENWLSQFYRYYLELRAQDQNSMPLAPVLLNQNLEFSKAERVLKLDNTP